jgi:hypothetical protein
LPEHRSVKYTRRRFAVALHRKQVVVTESNKETVAEDILLRVCLSHVTVDTVIRVLGEELVDEDRVRLIDALTSAAPFVDDSTDDKHSEALEAGDEDFEIVDSPFLRPVTTGFDLAEKIEQTNVDREIAEEPPF